MTTHKKAIHRTIKEALGYSADIDDKDFLKEWKQRSSSLSVLR